MADNLDAAVTSGSSQAPQQMDYVQAPEIGESNGVREHTSEPSKRDDPVPGIVKIVPSDDVRKSRLNDIRNQIIQCCLILIVIRFADCC